MGWGRETYQEANGWCDLPAQNCADQHPTQVTLSRIPVLELNSLMDLLIEVPCHTGHLDPE
jgi:hypothetical protein